VKVPRQRPHCSVELKRIVAERGRRVPLRCGLSRMAVSDESKPCPSTIDEEASKHGDDAGRLIGTPLYLRRRCKS